MRSLPPFLFAALLGACGPEDLLGGLGPAERSDDDYADGGWVPGDCPGLQSTGHRVGQVADDFALIDQFGETVRLHDYCDRQVLLVSSALWCSACQRAAPVFEDWFDTYRAEGFIVMTLIGEDSEGRPATPEHAALWADAFELSHPVLADPGWEITVRYTQSGAIAIPSMHQLGAGAVVLQAETVVSERDVRDALP